MFSCLKGDFQRGEKRNMKKNNQLCLGYRGSRGEINRNVLDRLLKQVRLLRPTPPRKPLLQPGKRVSLSLWALLATRFDELSTRSSLYTTICDASIGTTGVNSTDNRT